MKHPQEDQAEAEGNGAQKKPANYRCQKGATEVEQMLRVRLQHLSNVAATPPKSPLCVENFLVHV